jgi:hypothetical protein
MFDENEWEGYSLKTFTGSSPSLLNASRQTVFKYIIPDTIVNLETIQNIKKVKDKIKQINNQRDIANIISCGTVEQNFQHNLKLIEPNYDVILGQFLLNSIFFNSKHIKDLFTQDKDKNSIKELLWMSCLGMMPGAKYQIDNGNNCGLILYNGHELFIFKDSLELKDFLYENTKFDTPSTKRHLVVNRTSKMAENEFCLTLQIRLQCPKGYFKSKI